MRKGDLIGVYGTLRRGEHANHMMESLGSFVGPGRTKGTLYTTGGYPCLIKGSDEIVIDIYQIEHPEDIERIHTYEGYDPNDLEYSLFVADKTEIVGGRFDGLSCHIYYYNHDVDGFPKIESGDWLNRA